MQRRLDRRLQGAAADASASQSCGDHFAVIDHEGVAGTQEVGQTAHATVGQFRRGARAHNQEPRGIARHHGPQGDPFRRQLEVEQVGAHAPSYRRMGVGSSLAGQRALVGRIFCGKPVPTFPKKAPRADTGRARKSTQATLCRFRRGGALRSVRRDRRADARHRRRTAPPRAHSGRDRIPRPRT